MIQPDSVTGQTQGLLILEAYEDIWALNDAVLIYEAWGNAFLKLNSNF